MHVEQIYTGCLAHGAYYIRSGNEVAIIDPLREVQPYIDRATKDGAHIKYVLETHFHADFVSGHLDLAQKTGATIVYGPTAKPNFDAHIAADGEDLPLGEVKIRVLHTPGHTMESACFLLFDESGKDVALFSGDTLFIGDVGRPDLAQKAANMTAEELAATLYASLRNKIMTLRDDITVYPGHGAGSACGKNLSKETVSTIGEQKKFNYALRASMTEAEFVAEVLDGLTPPPGYFPMNVAMNKMGYESFDTVREHGLAALTAAQFEAVADTLEALVLDTRNPAEFVKGFVPKSINIGLDGQFAPWVGALIRDVKQPLLLIVDEGREEEAITRLARIGFDNVRGYLQGGIAAWKAAGYELDTVNRISTAQFAAEFKLGESTVLDVRREGEYRAEHISEAFNKPLDYINDWFTNVPQEHFYLHCAGGYRSAIAASILQARGIRHFSEVEGGFAAIAKTTVPRTDFVCQSKLQGV